MFVLGIDPGLTATGYGIVEEQRGRARPVAAGVIRTAAGSGVAARLAELYDDLRSLIAEYHPDEAAIEQVFTNRNRRTAIDVGRASGIALLAMGQCGLAVGEYTPSAVKAAVCGFGAADKEQVQRVVMARLGLPRLEAPDAADALAVALCHLQSSTAGRIAERVT